MTKQQGTLVVGAAADAVRLLIRQEQTVPKLIGLRHFLDEQKKVALSKSSLGQSVDKALNQRDDFVSLLEVGLPDAE